MKLPFAALALRTQSLLPYRLYVRSHADDGEANFVFKNKLVMAIDTLAVKHITPAFVHIFT